MAVTDTVIIGPTKGGKLNLNWSISEWARRGFKAITIENAKLKIEDRSGLGLLRNVFTLKGACLIEKTDNVKIQVSWRCLKLDKIIEDAIERLSEAGVDDSITRTELGGYQHGSYQMRYKTIVFGGLQVVTIHERCQDKGRDFFYERESRRSKRARRIQKILVPFLKKMKIKEKKW